MRLLSYIAMVLSFVLFVLTAKGIIQVEEGKMLNALIGSLGLTLVFGLMAYSQE